MQLCTFLEVSEQLQRHLQSYTVVLHNLRERVGDVDLRYEAKNLKRIRIGQSKVNRNLKHPGEQVVDDSLQMQALNLIGRKYVCDRPRRGLRAKRLARSERRSLGMR